MYITSQWALSQDCIICLTLKKSINIIHDNNLEEEMVTHSNILAKIIPWTEEPSGLQFMESQEVRHTWSDWARMHDNNKAYKPFDDLNSCRKSKW